MSLSTHVQGYLPTCPLGHPEGGNDEENDAYSLSCLRFSFCAWMFCLNVCVQRLEEGVGSPETGDTVEPPSECWEQTKCSEPPGTGQD